MKKIDELIVGGLGLMIVALALAFAFIPSQKAEALSNPLSDMTGFSVTCGEGVDGGTQDYTTSAVQPSSGAIPYRSIYCENVSTSPVYLGGPNLDYDGGAFTAGGPPICSDTSICGSTGRSFDGHTMFCTSAGVTMRCSAAE